MVHTITICNYVLGIFENRDKIYQRTIFDFSCHCDHQTKKGETNHTNS